MDHRTRLDQPESGIIEQALMSKRIADDTETSVAYPVCSSQITGPNFFHPGSWIQQQQQKRRRKYFFLFFPAINFTKKISNYFIFVQVQKKNLSQLIKNSFDPQNCY